MDSKSLFSLSWLIKNYFWRSMNVEKRLVHWQQKHAFITF